MPIPFRLIVTQVYSKGMAKAITNTTKEAKTKQALPPKGTAGAPVPHRLRWCWILTARMGVFQIPDIGESNQLHFLFCENIKSFQFLLPPLLSIRHLCPINMNTVHRQLGFRLIIGEAKNEKRGRECFWRSAPCPFSWYPIPQFFLKKFKPQSLDFVVCLVEISGIEPLTYTPISNFNIRKVAVFCIFTLIWVLIKRIFGGPLVTCLQGARKHILRNTWIIANICDLAWLL